MPQLKSVGVILRFVIDLPIVPRKSMQRGIFEKQRANPASQWSINDKLSLHMVPVEDNYTRDNWLVDSDA